MLAHLVRPLVRTQVQLLAQTHSARSNLMGLISQWLGYLGVKAEVQHLHTAGGKIQVSLTVSKPEQCNQDEWGKILTNIDLDQSIDNLSGEITYARMTSEQQSKAHRLLAHVIRVGGEADVLTSWDVFSPQLIAMGMNEAMLMGIQSALRAPTNLEFLLEGLDPEVAAFVLSRAIGLALMDRQINQDEDETLKALYGILRDTAMV